MTPKYLSKCYTEKGMTPDYRSSILKSVHVEESERISQDFNGLLLNVNKYLWKLLGVKVF